MPKRKNELRKMSDADLTKELQRLNKLVAEHVSELNRRAEKAPATIRLDREQDGRA